MKVIDFQSSPTEPTKDKPSGISSGKGVSLACFTGFDRDGRFLVTFKDGSEIIPALSTIRLTEDNIGADVAVDYIDNDRRKPIIIGRLRQSDSATKHLTLKMDGERVILHGENEIELSCGDASIVLTRAGKVLIKGTYVITRSSGANKIKGAYVDIN